jgi:DNA (cytosine-5)-methyltransferase 1
MISYNPLKITLIENGKEMKDLENNNGGILNKRTVSRLRHHKPVNITTLERVCLYLNVPIEKVVEIKPD